MTGTQIFGMFDWWTSLIMLIFSVEFLFKLLYNFQAQNVENCNSKEKIHVCWVCLQVFAEINSSVLMGSKGCNTKRVNRLTLNKNNRDNRDI